MRKNKRFCLHDARGKIWVVDDLWARRCPPWPNRSAIAERHSICTMIQTLCRSASIIQQAIVHVFNRTGDGTGVCLGVWSPVGLFWSRNCKPHSCKWPEALTKQTRMTRRPSCEDLHCSIFIFLKLSTLSGQGATVGSVEQGSDRSFASAAAPWGALWACRLLLYLLFVYDKIGYTRLRKHFKSGLLPRCVLFKVATGDDWTCYDLNNAFELMHVKRNIILLFDFETLD